MTNQITPNDWEDLSAYLDNQLSARERAELERRLQRTPELRQALAELDRVRMTLRRQPRMRAPRNFTLTPQMAGIRPGAKRATVMLPSAYPVLRLASILATLFFIVVSVGSLYVRTYGPAPREVSVAMDGQPMAGQRPGEGMGGGGGMAPPPEQPAPAIAMEAAVTQTDATTAGESESAAPEAAAQGVLEVTLEVSTPVPGELAAAPTLVPAEDLPADFANKMPGRPLPGKPPVPGQPVEAEAGQPDGSRGSQTGRLAWTVLLVVQVLLAILAVASAAAALYLRRSVRG